MAPTLRLGSNLACVSEMQRLGPLSDGQLAMVHGSAAALLAEGNISAESYVGFRQVEGDEGLQNLFRFFGNQKGKLQRNWPTGPQMGSMFPKAVFRSPRPRANGKPDSKNSTPESFVGRSRSGTKTHKR